MPYSSIGKERENEFKSFRIEHSLADWLKKCRKNCEVDRLRWFLRDFEKYCQRISGDTTMNSEGESEKKATIKYVTQNPTYLKTAQVVFDSWPEIKAKVCKEFLELLRCRIEKNVKEFSDNLQVKFHYEEGKYKSGIWLYRNCWKQYLGEIDNESKCTVIQLENQEKGLNDWFIGVCSPMSAHDMKEGDLKRRKCLVKQLEKSQELQGVLNRSNSNPWYPWGGYVDDSKRNWELLIPELYKECREKEGVYTKYFVDLFVKIAKHAIPIIDKIEG